MKICVIGPRDSKESLLIKNLAEDQGYVCKRIYMPDVYFEVEDSEFHARHRKLDLMEFDVFLFRSVSKHQNEAVLLAEYLHNEGKVVIDESLIHSHQGLLNNSYKLAKHNIPQLGLSHTTSLKAGRDVLMEISHPILIIANTEEKKEMNISEDWTDSYDVVRTSKSRNFTFQQYKKAFSYARVFVIGGKVVGGLNKEVMEEEPKLNHSRWARNRKLEVSPEMSEMAKAASNAVGYEICAVDILVDGEDLYVLGVHRAPKFAVFQRVAGVNFAEKIVAYALEKVNSRVNA
jgi:glutathione synthase/RimK-type ligase-like ATP-grasp enzyme